MTTFSFYLIASGGMVALSNRSVKRALLLYPKHEDYLKFLEKLDSASIGRSFKASQPGAAVVLSPTKNTAESAKENEEENATPSRHNTVSDFFSNLFGGRSAESQFADEGG